MVGYFAGSRIELEHDGVEDGLTIGNEMLGHGRPVPGGPHHRQDHSGAIEAMPTARGGWRRISTPSAGYQPVPGGMCWSSPRTARESSCAPVRCARRPPRPQAPRRNWPRDCPRARTGRHVLRDGKIFSSGRRHGNHQVQGNRLICAAPGKPITITRFGHSPLA